MAPSRGKDEYRSFAGSRGGGAALIGGGAAAGAGAGVAIDPNVPPAQFAQWSTAMMTTRPPPELGAASVTASGSGTASSSGGGSSSTSGVGTGAESEEARPPAASSVSAAKSPAAKRPPSPILKRPKRPMTAYNYFFREERQKVLDLGLESYEKSVLGVAAGAGGSDEAAAVAIDARPSAGSPNKMKETAASAASSGNDNGNDVDIDSTSQSPVGGESGNESGQSSSGSSGESGGGRKRPLRSDSSSLSSRVEEEAETSNGSECDSNSSSFDKEKNTKKPRVTIVGPTPGGGGGGDNANSKNAGETPSSSPPAVEAVPKKGQGHINGEAGVLGSGSENGSVVGRLVMGQRSDVSASASVSALSSSAPSSGGMPCSSASDSSLAACGPGFGSSSYNGARTTGEEETSVRSPTFSAFFSLSSSSQDNFPVPENSEAGSGSGSGSRGTRNSGGCGSGSGSDNNKDNAPAAGGNSDHPKPKATGKRKRPPPHGKVSFQALGRVIARRWRQVSPSSLERYNEMAERDKKRYKREMKKYDRAIVAEACMKNKALRAAHAAEGRPAFEKKMSTTSDLSSDSSSDGDTAAAKEKRLKTKDNDSGSGTAPSHGNVVPKRGALRKEAEAAMRAMNERLQAKSGSADQRQASILPTSQQDQLPQPTSAHQRVEGANTTSTATVQQLHRGFASMPSLANLPVTNLQASAAAAVPAPNAAQAPPPVAPPLPNNFGLNVPGNVAFPALTPQQIQTMGALQGLVTGVQQQPLNGGNGVAQGGGGNIWQGLQQQQQQPTGVPQGLQPSSAPFASPAPATMTAALPTSQGQQPPTRQRMDLTQALRLGFLAGLTAGGIGGGSQPGTGAAVERQDMSATAAAVSASSFADNNNAQSVNAILAQLAAGGASSSTVPPGAPSMGSSGGAVSNAHAPAAANANAAALAGMDGFIASVMAAALKQNQQAQAQPPSAPSQPTLHPSIVNAVTPAPAPVPVADDTDAVARGGRLHRHTSHRRPAGASSFGGGGGGGNNAPAAPSTTTATPSWTMGTFNGSALENGVGGTLQQLANGGVSNRSPPNSDMSAAALSDVVSALSDSSRGSGNGSTAGSLAPTNTAGAGTSAPALASAGTGGGQQQLGVSSSSRAAGAYTAGSTAAYLADQQHVSSSLGAELLMQRFLQNQLFMGGNHQSSQVFHGQSRNRSADSSPQQPRSPPD